MVGTTIWDVVVTIIRLDVPDTSTKEVATTSVLIVTKRTPDAEIAELRASNTSVGPPTPLVPRAFPPSNPEELCSEENLGMCDASSPVSLPVLVAAGELGREISVDVAGWLAPLGDSTSSEGSGVRVSCGG